MQYHNNLSDNQLSALLELLKGPFGKLLRSGAKLPANIKVVDAEMNKKAGVQVKKYHGCTRCHKHVWNEKDKGCVCPICQGPRYDAKGHPLELVIHFPLKPRLEALMKDSLPFHHAAEYEKYRSTPREKYKGVMAGAYFVYILPQ